MERIPLNFKTTKSFEVLKTREMFKRFKLDLSDRFKCLKPHNVSSGFRIGMLCGLLGF